jgi:hypothetical protein
VFASSAPESVSKMSFVTLMARWANEPPMSVSSAVHQVKAPWLAATAMPSSTGTAVADRNGSRVVRSASQNGLSLGRMVRPFSFESASR